MKILQINSVYKNGSTGRIVFELEQKIMERGYSSLVCYGRGTKYISDDVYRIGNDFDNKTHGIITRVFDKHGFASRKATLTLIQHIKSFNPDIVHLHNLHGYYINLQVLFEFLKELNKPVVWTLHDCWAITGHCAYFDLVDCDKWISQCKECVQKKQYPASILIDGSYMNYKRKKNLFNLFPNMTLIVPSKWLQDIVAKSYMKNHNCKVIYNGVNRDIFKPIETNIYSEKFGVKDKQIILGVAGIWDKRKGLDDFIALAEILEQNQVIVLIGLKENQMAGLPKNIWGVRHTENIEELAEMYSGADVFVNMSKEESFGLVTVEAMACGTPVIGYDATATPELIAEGCGLIVEKGNIRAVKMAIESIFANNKSLYKLNCIKHVKNNFDIIDKYEEYMQLYELLHMNKTK